MVLCSVPMELESDEEEKEKEKEENGENGAEEKEERSHIMEELWDEGVKLPPEPTGQCSRELQVRIGPTLGLVSSNSLIEKIKLIE